MDTSRDDATLYVRGLPAELVRRAKVLAAQRGTTLRAVVAEALEAAVREASGPTADAGDAGPGPLSHDLAWYEANREALAQRYPGKYLAIVDGEVVDHDADLAALAERTRARYDRPVLMPDTRLAERTAHLRSPRAAGV